jgi:predicted ribosomally synthesized peptide with SipW-like signal peptide
MTNTTIGFSFSYGGGGTYSSFTSYTTDASISKVGNSNVAN